MSSSVEYTYNADNAKLASIVIYFQKNRTPDDTLRITPSSKSTNFHIEFTQNSVLNRVERTIAYSELPYYLESVHGNWPYEIIGKKVELPSTTVNTVVELDDEPEEETEEQTEEEPACAPYICVKQEPVSAPCIRVTRSKPRARMA